MRAQRQHVDDEPLVTTAEVVHAMEFLLTNTGINAQDLHLDGGVTPT
ncbi:SDR family oxidoreductase [Actinopolyspora xinjiangensis]|nr:SDR family oxidoreductase [Actinopolyspora xinjiangensis]